MSNKDGGPAFPQPMIVGGLGATEYSELPGMTVLDYFMAHAPATPPKWFKPTMPPCPQPPDAHAITDKKVRDEVEFAMATDTDPKTPAAVAWMKKHSEDWDARLAWENALEVQRYVQWPRAWAEMQLTERAK